MKKIIHNLRQQPEQVRRHILHIIIIMLSIVMVLLWVYSLGKNLANPETEARVKRDLQPFSQLKDNIVDSYKNN